MGVIRRLPPSVVNQIAAGEVVERPSSVVKELLENAIDAGASRVDVSVERGGKDLVRVADNGAGMAAEDLPLAFQPHATSKLADVDDLYRVRTLGFRGEALAAIAEVARVRCQTRQAEAPEGSEIQIEAGVAGSVKTCGCPPGTVIEVRNLFFNTPVRRTFLKSDATEAGHVAETFVRVALAHPEVHWTFRSGGKVVHDLPPAAGMHERIAVFFGRELAESLLWVEGRLDRLHLWGYVGHPSQSRSSTKGQFLFLGGRYVRDRALAHALSEAYRGLLMVGRNPVVFLHLELPPEDVDVNVHPTKIEVRFRDPQRVYSHLLSTLRQTFLSSDLHARLQVAQEEPPGARAGSSREERTAAGGDRGGGAGAGGFGLSAGPPDRQAVASWFQPRPPAPAGTIPESVGRVEPPEWSRTLPSRFEFARDEAFNEFPPEASAQAEAPRPGPADGQAPAPPAALTPEAPAEEPRPPRERGSGSDGDPERDRGSGRDNDRDRGSDRDRGGGAPKAIQVHDSYLIAETSDGMMVIDQHALHERILYEELRARVAAGRVESQGLLVPEPVHLAADEAAAVLEHRAVLAALGLEVEEFGGGTVLVRSVPVMLGHVPAARLVRDLGEHLHTQPLPPTREGLLGELLHMVACKAAVKAGDRLSPDEIAALLDRRHLAADSHHCPHGRPAALVFTKAELEKQFGRV